MLKGLFKNLKKGKPSPVNSTQPLVISRAEHGISRTRISGNALKVLYRLHNAGYSAFLVGGCVRDLLLGRNPKDFDIATNALPEEVRKLFRNCRLIGKRFRLAHIVFGKEIIEVATFRTHHKDGQEHLGQTHKGMIIRDNMYGTIEDDAWRRDFTVNALYYNIADFSILDYTGGMQDLQDKVLRMIGHPEQRFHEDPVRILRALRFVGKLGLNIEPETEKYILQLNHLLENVSPSRLFQEVLKFFQEGATLPTFKLMQKYQVVARLFPQTAAMLSQHDTQKLIEEALISTDMRMKEGKTISPAFLLAVFLWHPVSKLMKHYQHTDDLPIHIAYEKALRAVSSQQSEALSIPRRLMITVYDICFLQHRLTCRYGSIPFRLLDHPRFRAGFDLLILRASAGEPIEELHTWWVQFYSGTHEQRVELLKAVQDLPGPKRKRSNRRRKKKPAPKNNTHPPQ